MQAFGLTMRTGSVESEGRRVVGVSTYLCRDRRFSSTSSWVTPAKKSFVSGEKWSNRYLHVVTVVTDNDSTKRFHARIAYTRARSVARSAMAVVRKELISGMTPVTGERILWM